MLRTAGRAAASLLILPLLTSTRTPRHHGGARPLLVLLLLAALALLGLPCGVGRVASEKSGHRHNQQVQHTPRDEQEVLTHEPHTRTHAPVAHLARASIGIQVSAVCPRALQAIAAGHDQQAAMALLQKVIDLDQALIEEFTKPEGVITAYGMSGPSGERMKDYLQEAKAAVAAIKEPNHFRRMKKWAEQVGQAVHASSF